MQGPQAVEQFMGRPQSHHGSHYAEGGPRLADRRGAVPEALDGLKNSMEELFGMLNKLQERLAPVLSNGPEPGVSEKGPPSREAPCRLANDIGQVSSAVSEMIGLVGRVLRNLEV